mmetsp:Transcript_18501/g.33398  ORF Transcript_18501/g.33398 Transcript_18501/m.33398 type:complete len:96 (+) Transcript_18501:4100-4387(+)
MADFSLPNSQIARIVKRALPDNFHASKNMKQALNRAACTFILYATTIAGDIAAENQGKQKTCVLKPEHILAALEEIDFGAYNESLEEPSLKRRLN